jgi:hypothetical protein
MRTKAISPIRWVFEAMCYSFWSFCQYYTPQRLTNYTKVAISLRSDPMAHSRCLFTIRSLHCKQGHRYFGSFLVSQMISIRCNTSGTCFLHGFWPINAWAWRLSTVGMPPLYSHGWRRTSRWRWFTLCFDMTTAYEPMPWLKQESLKLFLERITRRISCCSVSF